MSHRNWTRIGSYLALIFPLVIVGCAGNLSNIELRGDGAEGVIYPVSAAAADRIIAAAVADVFPGSQVERTTFPGRGYTATIYFVTDSHRITGVAAPQTGIDKSGARIKGFSFQVSHAGSMLVTGPARASELFETINKRAAAEQPAVAVSAVASASKDLDEVREACAKRTIDPVLEPIKGKLPFNGASEISVRMLSIEAFPTAVEVAAIAALTDMQNACARDTAEALDESAPNRVSGYESFRFKQDLVLAELVKRNMSYGNANRLLKEAYLDALDQSTRESKDEFARAQTLELERRRLAIDAERARAQANMARAATIAAMPKHDPPKLELQPLPARPSSSQTTKCSWVLHTLHCVSN